MNRAWKWWRVWLASCHHIPDSRELVLVHGWLLPASRSSSGSLCRLLLPLPLRCGLCQVCARLPGLLLLAGDPSVSLNPVNWRDVHRVGGELREEWGWWCPRISPRLLHLFSEHRLPDKRWRENSLLKENFSSWLLFYRLIKYLFMHDIRCENHILCLQM